MPERYDAIVRDRVAEALASWREATGGTWVQLAPQVGVEQSAISQYATKARTPPTVHLAALARVLNVSADYLLGISENRWHSRQYVQGMLARAAFQHGSLALFVCDGLPVTLIATTSSKLAALKFIRLTLEPFAHEGEPDVNAET